MQAIITAVGGYVPEYRLTNQVLETIIDTNDEWIKTRTGISERRILQGKHNGVSTMIIPAVQQIIDKKNLDPMEIDCIICGTTTADNVFPGVSNEVAYRIGAKNAYGFDLSAACSGFLFALTVGANLIESKRHKKVIVVGADKMSSIVNYSDRTTCMLFGDGAGAVLLEGTEEKLGFMDSILRSDGSGKDFLYMKGGGSSNPPSFDTVLGNQHVVFQEGQQVFKVAVKAMAGVCVDIMKKNNLSNKDIDWLVPHQANLRIINATVERMDISMDRVTINIEKFGNTTAATIPLCLWEWEKKFKKGQNIILTSFGGGFTWGATWIKWAY
ncbi:MAG: beta-ketoacyl-ACP synthase III [Phycisphaerales bacterium]|nr:beta-ketoacyl-ACP synthase III [Phycisphaerales bacterium]